MSDNQVLKPEHPPLVSVTSTSHTSPSESGAKPEPPSLTSTTSQPMAAHARITWPVPHIMVYYGNTVYAYGRRAIADMGKLAFLEWMYRRHVWTPKMTYGVAEPYQNQYFQRSRFKKEVGLVGTFYHIHGASDAGPVKLSALGWADMIQNVVKLEVRYSDEDSDGEEELLMKKE